MPGRRTTKTVRQTLAAEDEDRMKETLLLKDLEGQVNSMIKSFELNADIAFKKIKTNHKTALNKQRLATRGASFEAMVASQVKKESHAVGTQHFVMFFFLMHF